jgi:hypothetical protein
MGNHPVKTQTKHLEGRVIKDVPGSTETPDTDSIRGSGHRQYHNLDDEESTLSHRRTRKTMRVTQTREISERSQT